MNIDLSSTTYGRVRQESYDIAILPWGATEPHNLHLPYLTDCHLAQDIALEAAKEAWPRGTHCMVLPPVTFGSQNPGQRELPFCIHARYETQRAILGDVVESLNAQGIRKLVIINAHGGNSFKNMIRDLAIGYPDFMIVAGEWFKAVNAKDYFEMPLDHADELETSVMMYYHPELVNLEDAGEGKSRNWSIPFLRNGKAWAPRNWQKVSDDTGIGNPSLSSAEKGEAFAKACVREWAQFLVDFAKCEDFYEK